MYKFPIALLISAFYAAAPLLAQNDQPADYRVEYLLQQTYANAEGDLVHLNAPYGEHAEAIISRDRPAEYAELVQEEVITIRHWTVDGEPNFIATVAYREQFEQAMHRSGPYPLLNSNVGTSLPDGATLPDIHTYFNQARDEEEAQVVASGTITDMPSLATVQDSVQLFWIIANDDRTARANVTYTNFDVAPLGLPFADMEANLMQGAGDHAQYMADNQAFVHSSVNYYDNHPVLGLMASTRGGSCQEGYVPIENIAIASGTDAMRGVAAAQYIWVYEDAPNWGHRGLALGQDTIYQSLTTGGQDLPWLDNNYGASTSEGFLGLGIAKGMAPWGPFPAVYVVAHYMDPIANLNNECAYQPLGMAAASALPVDLATFTVNDLDEVVEARWQTHLETDMSHYVVERSGDGKTFYSLGVVTAVGSLSGATDYRYTDHTPLPGTSYYRLRMVESDGNYRHSEVVAITRRSDRAPLAVYPNPTEGTLYANQPITLTLYDLTGRELWQGSGSTFDLGSLPKGAYLGRMQNDEGTVRVQRVVVR